MSYSGTTAATTLVNPPVRVAGSIALSTVNTSSGLGGGSLWVYKSSDSFSNIYTTGYFTDGRLLGMRSGDILIAAICSGTSAGTSVAIGMGVIACATATTNYACWWASTGAFIASDR